MSTGLILVVVIAIAVIVYFMFFNESKQVYPENKIKEVFEYADKLLEPHEDDVGFVISKKEAIIEELRSMKSFYSRNPSLYTQKEIVVFEEIIAMLKQELREYCDNLEDLKPKILAVIESEKSMIEAANKAMKLTEDVGDDSQDDQDVMDLMEKILETSPIKIKEKEDELIKLEKSILRYKSL